MWVLFNGPIVQIDCAFHVSRIRFVMRFASKFRCLGRCFAIRFTSGNMSACSVRERCCSCGSDTEAIFCDVQVCDISSPIIGRTQGIFMSHPSTFTHRARLFTAFMYNMDTTRIERLFFRTSPGGIALQTLFQVSRYA